MSSNGPCVLVVEDEIAAREVIVDSLEAEGCTVVGASDGAEAKERLEKTPQPPCEILLDLMMPRMNGWQFRDWQRADPRFAPIPVVVLSAVRNVPEEAKKLGAAAYLAKPVTYESLLDTVQKLCGPCAG